MAELLTLKNFIVAAAIGLAAILIHSFLPKEIQEKEIAGIIFGIVLLNCGLFLAAYLFYIPTLFLTAVFWIVSTV